MDSQPQHEQLGHGYHDQRPEDSQPPEAQGKTEPQQQQDLPPPQVQIGMGQQYSQHAYGYQPPPHQQNPPVGVSNAYYRYANVPYAPPFQPMLYGGYGFQHPPTMQPNIQEGHQQQNQLQGQQGNPEPFQQPHQPHQHRPHAFQHGAPQQFQPGNQQPFMQAPHQHYQYFAQPQLHYGWSPQGYNPPPFFGNQVRAASHDPTPAPTYQPPPQDQEQEGVSAPQQHQAFPHGTYPMPPTVDGPPPPMTAHPYYSQVGSHAHTPDPNHHVQAPQQNEGPPEQQHGTYPMPSQAMTGGQPYPTLHVPAVPVSAAPALAPAPVPQPDIKPAAAPTPAPAARTSRSTRLSRQGSLAPDHGSANNTAAAANIPTDGDDMTSNHVTRRSTRTAGTTPAMAARAQLATEGYSTETPRPLAITPPPGTALPPLSPSRWVMGTAPPPYGDGATDQRYRCSPETERLHRRAVERRGGRAKDVHAVRHTRDCCECRRAKKKGCDRLWPCVHCTRMDRRFGDCKYTPTEEVPEDSEPEDDAEVEAEGDGEQGTADGDVGTAAGSPAEGSMSMDTNSPAEDGMNMDVSSPAKEGTGVDVSSPAEEQQEEEQEEQQKESAGEKPSPGERPGVEQREEPATPTANQESSVDGTDAAEDVEMGGTLPHGDMSSVTDNNPSATSPQEDDISIEMEGQKSPAVEDYFSAEESTPQATTPPFGPAPDPTPKGPPLQTTNTTSSAPSTSTSHTDTGTLAQPAAPGTFALTPEQMQFLMSNPGAARLFGNFLGVGQASSSLAPQQALPPQPSSAQTPQQQQQSSPPHEVLSSSPVGPINLGQLAARMQRHGHEELGPMRPLNEQVDEMFREKDN